MQTASGSLIGVGLCTEEASGYFDPPAHTVRMLTRHVLLIRLYTVQHFYKANVPNFFNLLLNDTLLCHSCLSNI